MLTFISRKKLGNKLLDVWFANPSNECVEHVCFAMDLLGNDLRGTVAECKRELDFILFLERRNLQQA